MPILANILLRPAPEVDLPAPTVEVVTDAVVGAQRIVTLRMVSQRNPEIMVLSVSRAMGLTSLDIPAADRSIQYPVSSQGAFDAFTCYGRSCNGLEVTLQLAAGQEFDLTVTDLSTGLPAEGEALLAARPATATPVHDGDLTLVSNVVRIGVGE